MTTQPSRRSVLKAAATAGAAAVLPAALPIGPAAAAAFKHPGLLHTQADFDRMRAQVNAGAQPWKAGWDKLTANGRSRGTWKPRPLETVVRGGTGANHVQLAIDVAAAYQNALRWKISGEKAHGDAARDILNAWSAALKTVTGNADRYLAAGILGWQLANVAEIMRGYPGFDFERFTKMMLTVFYPMNDRFLKETFRVPDAVAAACELLMSGPVKVGELSGDPGEAVKIAQALVELGLCAPPAP
ncbi:twin-arginine translocation signal domain-containing protein [Nonomuraea sp. NPDC003709]|uniref:twin-arginine translocation signal domain-containing protein n=1 Tax=Nonomuraea sp. NPDC003709 TaxID=3154450 RepID=UPI0033AE66B7